MITNAEELNSRLSRLEKQNDEEVLTLVEILSNATFFGEIKKANCKYVKNGQCSFFVLRTEAKNKIPTVKDCRIKDCKEPFLHCHLELTNITCSLCQQLQRTRRSSASRNTNVAKKQAKKEKKFISQS
jgi:hypothetical protein